MKFKILIITLLVCILIILIPTLINVSNEHKESLYLVTEKRITEAAMLCLKEENCSGTKITLGKLYEYTYINNEYDPVTKKYYDENSYVLVTNDSAEFFPIS